MTDAQLILTLALVGGALSLDATAAFQLMLSQPIVAAAVAGTVAGDPLLGLAVGAALQLVWIGALPVGAAPFPDGAIAGTVGVGMAVILERAGAPTGIGVTVGLVAGLLSGTLGQKVTGVVRRLNTVYAVRAEARARQGDPGGVRSAVALGLATRFATGALAVAALLGVGMFLKPLSTIDLVGEVPTLLWAAPVAAAVVAFTGRMRWEVSFLAGGFAVGLLLVALV